MSKPLTIEELKSLEVGDWVWIVTLQDEYRPNDVPYGEYHKIVGTLSHYYFEVNYGVSDYYELSYSDYGTTWLAYKNKEQAEAKGEIVELPYKVGDKVYLVRGNRVGNMVVSRTKIEMYLYHNRLLVKCSCDSSWHELKNIFTIEEQAAARLKELKGEE